VVEVFNVHLEDTNKGSETHLNHILRLCARRDIKSIIAGDFNMYLTDVMKKLSEKHELIIVTSRTISKEERTKKWIKKYLNLIFT